MYYICSNLGGLFRICIYLFLTILYLRTQAQSDDFRRDEVFFNQQAKLYQKWLDREGIGRYLSVRDMKVKKDHLSLYLQLRYQNLDSILGVWDQIKASYELGTSLSLEEQLFYKLSFLMEVNQSQLDIQVYDTYDTQEKTLFFRGIYFEEAIGKIEVKTSDPSSQTVEIKIPTSQLPKRKDMSTATIDYAGSQFDLFKRIITFAQEKYVNPTCEGRRPIFKVLQTEDVLRFRAYNLCQVVLVDETRSFVCRIFGCNDIIRELLEFTITYEPSHTGVKLRITLDGKFGSGFYGHVRRGAYHDMSEEPEFERIYLKEYADEFQRELKAYLKP